MGYGNILNAEENEKEEKVHNTDQGENPTAFHSVTSTGQDTKKPPLAYEEKAGGRTGWGEKLRS